MPVRRSSARVSAARLTAIARRLLRASALCAIATVSADGRAHVNTAYFAWSPAFEIVWISAPEARHSRNLQRRSSAAIAVYDSTQTWGHPDRGIQLFGAAREVSGSDARDAERIYGRRFKAYVREKISAYHLYRFRPRTLKLFHEGELGGGTFVTARVGRGGRLTWQRTESYAAS